jgi:hypothetical protein
LIRTGRTRIFSGVRGGLRGRRGKTLGRNAGEKYGKHEKRGKQPSSDAFGERLTQSPFLAVLVRLSD